MNAVARRHASSILADGGIGLDASGGAINRVPVNATAFTHRNDLFSAQYSASWTVGDASSVVSANHTWLTDTWQAMRPYASGAAYQNYIDPYLTDWQHAYYGTNLARLQHIKATYDAANFFHFAQSIPPVTLNWQCYAPSLAWLAAHQGIRFHLQIYNHVPQAHVRSWPYLVVQSMRRANAFPTDN